MKQERTNITAGREKERMWKKKATDRNIYEVRLKEQ